MCETDTEANGGTTCPSFFASCPKDFERLLADELRELGIPKPRPLRGQVAFSGTLEDAYRVCLWSRLASRIVLVLGRVDAPDSDALYEGVSSIAWEEHTLAPLLSPSTPTVPTPSSKILDSRP